MISKTALSIKEGLFLSIAKCFRMLSWGSFLGLSVANAQPTKEIISIELYASAVIRGAFQPLFDQFEAETGIGVKIHRYISDDEFNAEQDRQLSAGINIPDVLYGSSSERLYRLVRKGLVHPITALSINGQWQDKFRREHLEWVTWQGEVYALPYGYYTWGLFYSDDLIDMFGEVPTAWQEFLHYCQKLKQAGIPPFPASKEQPWVAAAWFEYLVLRIYGLETFQQIMAGKLSFHDDKIQDVFAQWQSMVKQGFFSSQFNNARWEESLPHLLRNKLGFIFMGTILASRIFSNNIAKRVEFTAFPKINDIPRYETAPTEVFFISQKSPNKRAAEKFLIFLSDPKIQSHLAERLHSAPAHKKGTVSTGKFSMRGYDLLKSAAGISPFFDRGATAEFGEVAVHAFAEFLQTGNSKKLTETLELSRLRFYKGAL